MKKERKNSKKNTELKNPFITQNEQERMFEEIIYRKQLRCSHFVMGKDYVPKYDTGKPRGEDEDGK